MSREVAGRGDWNFNFPKEDVKQGKTKGFTLHRRDNSFQEASGQKERWLSVQMNMDVEGQESVDAPTEKQKGIGAEQES